MGNQSIQNPDSEELAPKVKRLLSESLGVEVEDISDDDSFSEDLHMAPDKLADFVETLSSANIDASQLTLTEIDTVGELIETLSSQEEIK